MSDRRTTYIDESYTSRGATVMAAVVLTDPEARAVREALDPAYRGPGGEPFHCNKESSARRAEFIAAAVGAMPPRRAHLVYYRQPDSEEGASRDAALASLLHRIVDELSRSDDQLYRLVIDTRRMMNDPRGAERLNDADRTTIAGLKERYRDQYGDRLHNVRVNFADDRRTPELWVPDALAWHARRSIEHNSPDDLLAYRAAAAPLRIDHARLQPGTYDPAPPGAVQAHLNHLMARLHNNQPATERAEAVLANFPSHLRRFPGDHPKRDRRPGSGQQLPDAPAVSDTTVSRSLRGDRRDL